MQVQGTGPGAIGANSDTRSGDYVLSVKKAFTILRLLSAGERQMSIAEMARETRLGRTVTHRLVATLESEGVLDRDPETGKYRIGLEAFAIGSAAVRHATLRGEVTRQLAKLALVHDTCAFMIESQLQALCVERVDSEFPLQDTRPLIGERMPLYCGGAAFALFSFLPPEKVACVLSHPIVAVTSRTVTDPALIRSRIAEVVAYGYVIGDEDAFEHAITMGAPIFGQGGQLLGAISISGVKAHYPETRIPNALADLVQAAAGISARMGFLGAEAVWPGLLGSSRRP